MAVLCDSETKQPQCVRAGQQQCRMSFAVSLAGVAVWRERGGAALLQDCPHWASTQALHGGPDRPCAQERAARGRGLDGWVQEPCLHGLEHSPGGESHSRASRPCLQVLLGLVPTWNLSFLVGFYLYVCIYFYLTHRHEVYAYTYTIAYGHIYIYGCVLFYNNFFVFRFLKS